MGKSLTNRNIGSSYKDLLTVDGDSGGVSSSLKSLCDGDGNDTSVQISNNKVLVKTTSNTNGAFSVQNSSGTNILNVDTSSNTVQSGANNYYNNCGIMKFFAWQPHGNVTVNEHYAMIYNTILKEQVGISLGTGTDPSTTYDVSTDESDAVHGSWLAPLCYKEITKSIEIESIDLWYSCKHDSGSTSPQFYVHVNEYTANLSGTTGDLSSGSLIAYSGGGSAITASKDASKKASLVVNTSSLTANVGTTTKVIVPSIKTTTVGDFDLIVRLEIKYHLA